MRSYRQAAEHLGHKADRPLSGRATRLQRRDDHTIAVRYQGTDVVTYHDSGDGDDPAAPFITLRNDGFFTSTTKARIAEYSRARIWQDRGIWYIGGDWPNRDNRSLFYDGMELREDGTPIAPRAPAATEGFKRQLDRMVSKYVKGYAAAVCVCSAEPFALPGPGDCLYCQIELSRVGVPGSYPGTIHTGHLSPDGYTEDRSARPFGVNHVLAHMAERYYVPSLYACACVARHYGGGPGIGWQMGITQKDRKWITRDLGYYLRQLKPALLAALEGGWTPERDGIEVAS